MSMMTTTFTVLFRSKDGVISDGDQANAWSKEDDTQVQVDPQGQQETQEETTVQTLSKADGQVQPSNGRWLF